MGNILEEMFLGIPFDAVETTGSIHHIKDTNERIDIQMQSFQPINLSQGTRLPSRCACQSERETVIGFLDIHRTIIRAP